jgi:ureidoglycolate lyase
MTRMLNPEPLTAEAFAPFGDVIEALGEARPINYGATKRFHDLADIDCAAAEGRVIVNIFRSLPPQFPFEIKVMERHPLSSQAFVPLSGRPFLVVVAPRGDFDPAAIRAFRAGPHQGVNFARGTWHHFNLALDGESDFLVIDREGPAAEGPDGNCAEVTLDPPLLLAP